jgi:cytochrome c556
MKNKGELHMKHRTVCRSVVALIAIIAFSFSFAVYAQEREAEHVADSKTEVPALTQFHSVIHPLWHEAWPNKDYGMLAKLLPDIERHVAEVAAVKLPGVLHEKQNAWDTNIKSLQQIAGEYKSAVEKKENQKLLDAAEKLHSQFEKLVQLIRPVLKEIGDFHEALYMLYHHYLPAYDLEKIRASVSELQTKMAALNKAVLPERAKSKSAAFEENRKKLDASITALVETVKSGDEKTIKAAIETMHGDYESLHKLFD